MIIKHTPFTARTISLLGDGEHYINSLTSYTQNPLGLSIFTVVRIPLPKFLNKVLHHSVIKVLTSKVGVSGRGLT